LASGIELIVPNQDISSPPTILQTQSRYLQISGLHRGTTCPRSHHEYLGSTTSSPHSTRSALAYICRCIIGRFYISSPHSIYLPHLTPNFPPNHQRYYAHRRYTRFWVFPRFRVHLHTRWTPLVVHLAIALVGQSHSSRRTSLERYN
jgi:hypothetical protein